MSTEDNYSLVKGSVYRVRSAGAGDQGIETEGEFLGYQQFGEETSLSIRIAGKEGPGSVRIIPCSAVLYVDVIRQAPQEKSNNSRKEKVEFYG